MKNNKYLASTIATLVTVLILNAGFVNATLVPSFFLAQANNTSQTQVTVLGADPNASVTLYYPQGGTYSSITVGTTDSSGRLSTTIDPTAHNITSGGVGYVIVDGAQSQTQVWPTYTASSANSSTGLSLSQNNLTIVAGQSTAISASANSGTLGTLSIPSNTNPSAASASVSGNQVIVNTYAAGSTVLTVCSSNVGCSTMYVTVQSQSLSTNTPVTSTNQSISFTPTTISMRVGESRTISLSGSGSYYISSHSSAGIAATSISGSMLTVTGSIVGNDNMGICSSGSSTLSCATLNVTVTSADSASANSTNNGTVTLSPNSLTLSVGQTLTATVSGTGLGSFYISNNSGSDYVGANIAGNIVSVTGNKAGGGNITVCQLGGACGSLYAFVPAVAGAITPVTSTTNQPVALSSFSITSNNVSNQFLGSGVALTIGFSFNQAVSSPMVSIGGGGVPVFGNGSGPYTAIYTMNGSEATPLNVVISFNGSTARFTIGGPNSGSTDSAPSASSGSNKTFTLYLQSGSTGSQVTALQIRLKALGVYSGPITGTFGAQTEAAVKKYQEKHKINQLGAVGPATRTLLNQGE